MTWFAGKRRRRVQVDLNDRDRDGNVIQLTKQSDLDASDIRNIMKRYRKTGLVSGSVKSAFYGDISDAPDFLAAMQVVARAQQQFEALPASLRDRFNNDPAKFMAFVHDPETDKSELIKLGILNKPKEPEPPPAPMKVEVVNPPSIPDKK